MSLARGEESVGSSPGAPTYVVPERPALVVAVASTPEDRARIAGALDGTAPVLLVGSVREAVGLLLRDVSVADLVVGEVDPEPAVTTPLRVLGDVPADREPIVDSDARVLRYRRREVDLTPLEHDLLVHLLAADGCVCTFEDLQHEVWGNDHQGGRTHVQSVVKRLRRKLEEVRSPLRLDGVRGVGLRLVRVPE